MGEVDELRLWREQLIVELYGRAIDLALLERNRRWTELIADADAALRRARELLDEPG